VESLAEHVDLLALVPKDRDDMSLQFGQLKLDALEPYLAGHVCTSSLC